MRTTIILDDELGSRFRKTARDRGMSLSAFLAEAGKAALTGHVAAEEPFMLITEGEGGTLAGLNLDRTSELLAAEDEVQYGV